MRLVLSLILGTILAMPSQCLCESTDHSDRDQQDSGHGSSKSKPVSHDHCAHSLSPHGPNNQGHSGHDHGRKDHHSHDHSNHDHNKGGGGADSCCLTTACVPVAVTSDEFLGAEPLCYDFSPSLEMEAVGIASTSIYLENGHALGATGPPCDPTRLTLSTFLSLLQRWLI